tara:strand:+ start:1001 stop:1528 length:528 start_codon:yes stop_codon:yes gene_type:complete
MVKNLKGGTGHKKLARKNESSHRSNKLRVPDSELEIFGCVTKMFGNGMCEIVTNENIYLMGHIRGNFRGKQKRHNTITRTSIVLVGLRDWESVQKNCDILSLYTDSDIAQIKNIPNINIEYLISLRIGAGDCKEHTEFDFKDVIDDEENTLKINSTIPVNSFKLNDVPDVDENDI